MPRSMAGLLAAVGTAMSVLAGQAHGRLFWIVMAVAAAAVGLAAYAAALSGLAAYQAPLAIKKSFVEFMQFLSSTITVSTSADVLCLRRSAACFRAWLRSGGGAAPYHVRHFGPDPVTHRL